MRKGIIICLSLVLVGFCGIAFALPPAPTQFFATPISGTEVRLEWKTPGTASPVKLDAKFKMNGSVTTLTWAGITPDNITGEPAPVANTTQSKLVSGLVKATNYCFGIRYQDSTGLSPIAQACTTTLNTGAQVTLAWDANTETNLAGYRLYLGNAPRTYNRTIDVGLGTAYTTIVYAGETVYYTLTAYNTNKLESGFSNEVKYPQ